MKEHTGGMEADAYWRKMQEALLVRYCIACGLEMKLHPEMNTYLPCPECGSTSAKTQFKRLQWVASGF